MANMATCPNCGRPVSGRARRCGYCGESLLEDYFSAPGMELGGEEGPSAGATAATVLGSVGAVALLVALGFPLRVGFGLVAAHPRDDRPSGRLSRAAAAARRAPQIAGV